MILKFLQIVINSYSSNSTSEDGHSSELWSDDELERYVKAYIFLFCNVQLEGRGRNVSISLSHVCIHLLCNQTFFILKMAMIKLGIL
jgi:hypothetical protein